MYPYVNSPFLNILINLFLNIICYFLSLLEQILKDKLSTSIFEDSISNLSYGKTEILNSVICVPWIYHLVIYSSIDVYGHVIFSYDVLA